MVAIHISGVHCHISDKVRAYIADKLGSLQRYYPRLGSVHVTIHHAEKHGYRVDVDLHLPTGKDVVAHDREEGLFSAIDAVAQKCATQLRKIHEKEVEPQRIRA